MFPKINSEGDHMHLSNGGESVYRMWWADSIKQDVDTWQSGDICLDSVIIKFHSFNHPSLEADWSLTQQSTHTMHITHHADIMI